MCSFQLTSQTFPDPGTSFLHSDRVCAGPDYCQVERLFIPFISELQKVGYSMCIKYFVHAFGLTSYHHPDMAINCAIPLVARQLLTKYT